MTSNDALQHAFHRAFLPELHRAVDDLPIARNGRVLDLCCGDGFYTALLLKRLGRDGQLVAADLSDGYLERTKARFAQRRPAATLRVIKADAYSLPFDDGAFDLVWCAQSFITLDEPTRALREMHRVVKPGGLIAILESDEYHHVLLPWPVDLEVAIQRAIAATMRERFGQPSRVAPARRLPALLRQASFKPRRKRTYAADRQQPFAPAVKKFIKEHIKFLRGAVRAQVSKKEWRQIEELTDARRASYILRRRDWDITCLNVMYLATRD